MENDIKNWFNNNSTDILKYISCDNKKFTISLKLNNKYENINIQYDMIDDKLSFIILNEETIKYLKKFNEQLKIKKISLNGLLNSLLGIHKKYLFENNNKESYYSYHEDNIDLYDYSKLKKITYNHSLPNFKSNEHFVINKKINDYEIYITNYAKIIFLNHKTNSSENSDYNFLMPIDYINILEQFINIFCHESEFTFSNFKNILDNMKLMISYRKKYIDNIILLNDKFN